MHMNGFASRPSSAADNPWISACSGGTHLVKRRCSSNQLEVHMGFGKGALLWLIGIPLPVILLLAFFWH